MGISQTIPQDTPFEVHITPNSVCVRIVRQLHEGQTFALINRLRKIQDGSGLTNMVFDLSEQASITLSLLNTLQRFVNESRNQGWTVRFIRTTPPMVSAWKREPGKTTAAPHRLSHY